MGVPDHRGTRISDADRERAVQRLNEAVGEGRLDLEEFQERVDAVLRARTFGEVEPHLADLPVALGMALAPEYGEVRASMSGIRRTGQWVVPRKLAVRNRAGSVKLDLTTAVVSHPMIEIALEVYAGSTTVVLPRGASVDIDQVQLVASSAKVRVPTIPVPGGGPHVVLTGKQRAGGLRVRHQRRFWRWRW